MRKFMPYTVVPMEKLDEIRALTHVRLRELSAVTGKKYKIRTFYLGPRKKERDMHLKRCYATGAKIGIYETKSGSYGSWPSLVAYV